MNVNAAQTGLIWMCRDIIYLVTAGWSFADIVQPVIWWGDFYML